MHHIYIKNYEKHAKYTKQRKMTTFSKLKNIFMHANK